MSFFQTLALMGLAASPATAFWRLPCAAPVTVDRLDPIVNPGTVSGHLHTVMGGNAFANVMDYNTTQSSDCTSCKVKGDMSNYWTPNLYFKHQDGTFEQVKQVGGMLVYYLQRTGQKGEKLEAFPEGFRMVAGDPMKRSGGTDFPTQAISYNCLDYKGKPKPETNMFPNYNCPSGLRSQVFFPSCWDGKNLDSPDHKSHMAYPVNAYNTGSCPPTHPRHLISIFYEIIWDTNAFADKWYGGSQPFVWSMGDPTGYGFHGDFLNGWDVNLLQRAVDRCTNDSGRVEDCGEFQLYADKDANQCKKPATVVEPSNFLAALPGCNPVQDGPARASAQAGCAGAPALPSGGTPNPPVNSGTPNPPVNSGTPNPPAGGNGGDNNNGPVLSSTTTANALTSTTTTKGHKGKATTTTTTKVGAGKFYQSTSSVSATPTVCTAGKHVVTVTQTVVSTVYGAGAGMSAQTTNVAAAGAYKQRMHKRVHGAKHAERHY